jgi:hypothetical protein
MIFEFRIFYKDILRIKNKKYCFWKYIIYVSHILKIHKFILKIDVFLYFLFD